MIVAEAGWRELGVSDLLRPSDSELEAALEASADQWRTEAAKTLPALALADVPFRVSLDAGALLGELSALAWSGSKLFSAIACNAGEPVPSVTLFGPVDVAGLLRADLAIIARSVQVQLPSIADLHDRLTSAWNVALEVSVVVTSRDVEVPVSARSMMAVALGSARVGSSTSELMGQGWGRVVPAGNVAICTDEFTVLVVLEMREFGPRTVLEQLIRSAGYDPRFRADLPRRPDAPFTSYGGSLLDDPGTLGSAALAVFDDGVPVQARCWWNASLHFAPGVLDVYARSSEWTLRWPAPPAFGDRRLLWAGGRDDLVLAMAGHVVGIAPDLHDQLLELAMGGSITVASTLYRVFADIDLLVPARA